ncbi:MAG: PstS family phosphate ABC transporter substrate-binding protein [Clostridium argentinense]|uniref:Phosphate-binding protein n=1 Tax=Clostridium faecium TaxID=2762223 RepID=A0ABR8YPH9_9CLOT|nr:MULTISPECIES: PstS family phosphate ABC transporter substrate-binding protein [Clostridium]MBD8046153.1 PstS family phosphate ABC transporter substrate-binding protein [Clostridium faecium]MBS5823642.1 PstS family phosphate ABC transporter substrate-binding protein [Clostridium argentinense]MDU1347721.1 PstS family phosphate ABC transporter substrate-binding protein [Clostridium argentinense]
MKKKSIKFIITSLLVTTSLGIFAGCGKSLVEGEGNLTGEIKIDGSSTVAPITEGMAEEFNKIHRNVKIPIGVSGTGGGFKRFTAKEIDINDASRAIKDKERAEAEKNGVDYTDFKIAFDGVTLVVNKDNTWVDTLTVEELKNIWNPDSNIKTWKDIKKEWPAEEIKFYSPGTDSGTFDYFTEEINKKSGAIRPDITPSEDDNTLVQGIAGDKNAIGFFGYSYYEENKEKLKAVKIDNGKGGIEPSFETIKDGSYAPLSRPLFLYVNNESLKREEVKEFLKFYLSEGKDIISEIGYVELPDEEYNVELGKIK